MLTDRKQNKHAPDVPVWDPTEQYNPVRPNDYFEYKAWKKREQEEKRRRRESERKRYRAGSHSDSDSYYSEDDYDRPRKNGACGISFTWLILTGKRVARWEEDDYERCDEPPAVVDTSLTGDEAYARRLAMSQGIPMHPPVPAPVSVSPPAAETGEEAYQRRLAMSQGRAPTTFSAPAAEPSPPPPEPIIFPVTQPPPPPPPERQNLDFEERVKQSRDAAAAVAARLAKLAAMAPPDEPAPATNAEETDNGYASLTNIFFTQSSRCC